MKKLVLLLAALALFGCVAQPETPGANTGNGVTPSAEPSFAPSTAPSAEPSEIATPSAAPHPIYRASLMMLQFSQKVRVTVGDARSDNITRAFAAEVGLSNITDGMMGARPIEHPERAIIKLVAPDGTETQLNYGEEAQAEADSLPEMFWPVKSTSKDDTEARFVASVNALKAGGEYTFKIDADGDGVVDGEHKLTLPGFAITNPQYGSTQSTGGFKVEWTQAGRPQDYLYRVSVDKNDLSSNYLGGPDTPLNSTSLDATPEYFGGTIEPGMFVVSLQADGGGQSLMDEALQNYLQTGTTNEKVIFYGTTVREKTVEQFKVGQFCHCEDLFQPTVCTIDELQADPLCG